MRKPSPDILRRFRNYPALSFHYGLSYLEVLRMPRWLRDIYVEELPALVAQQQLLMIEAAAIPWMEKDDRARAIKSLQRIAETGHEPETMSGPPKKILSQEMYAAHMAAAGIPITFVNGPADHAEEVDDARSG